MANGNPEEKYYNKFGPDLNKDFLVRDQSFLTDARRFLGERKDYSLSELRDPEEVYKLFIRHMRHTEINELAAFNDLRHINDLNDDGKAQMGKLYSVWDRMEGSKSSIANTFKDYGLGIVTSPATYVSVVTGGISKLVGASGAVAARLAAREAALGALKKTIANQKLKIATALPTNLMARRVVTGAVGAGTVEGVVGATIGGAGEAVRTRADITGEREFRISQPIIHGLFGAGLGAGIGAGVGAFTAKRQMKMLGIETKAAQANAGKTAAAEKQVARTVYDFDPTEAVEGTAKAGVKTKATKANEKKYHDILSSLLKRNNLKPISRKVVERGMKASGRLWDETTAQIPFPKTTWRKTKDGVYNAEIGKLSIFSEITRSGTRGNYSYTVSTGKKATDLTANTQTFKTLQEAKNAVPSIVREQKLLPTLTDDFTLMISNRTTEEAAASIQGRLAGLMMQVLKDAKKIKVGGKPVYDEAIEIDFKAELPVTGKVESLLNQRFTMIMHKVLSQSTPEQQGKYIGDLLKKYNLTLGELSDIYAADLSYAGRLLGIQSGLSRAVTRAAINEFAEGAMAIKGVEVPVQRISDTGEPITEQMQIMFTPEGETFIKSMTDGDSSLMTWLQSQTKHRPIHIAGAGIAEFDRFTKGFMTVQIATTMRNLENATIRAPLYMLTNLLQGTFEYAAAAARRTGGAEGATELRAVDMRKALSRMATPVMFTKNMLDPAEGKLMFNFFESGFKQEYSTYIRQLADVEGGMLGGPLTKFARKMNALNTFIDNAFKRGIYTTELGQRVGHRRLIQLSEDGRFNEIPFEHQLGAMNAGLDFTYQTRFIGPGKIERLVTFVEEPTGKFDKNGEAIIKRSTKVLDATVDANTIANKFVNGFSIPIVGSGLIPYPRFVASYLKHTFEYAPFVGMIPLERFGWRQPAAKGQKFAINLGKELQDKLNAENVVRIVAENPKGDDARSILTQYKGGLKGKEWSTTVNRANRKLTHSERQVLDSYNQTGRDKPVALGFFRPGRSIHKIAAQQISGMSLLYGAIQLRAAQGPEAEWYEMHKLPFTGDVGPKGIFADARAFYGVYLPYMLIADLLLGSVNWLTGTEDKDTIRSWVVANKIDKEAMENSVRESVTAVALSGDKIRDYFEVAFGHSFKTGQGLAWMDRIAKQYQENPDMSNSRVLMRMVETITEVVAQYLQRATVPFGMFKDVMGNVNPLWKDIPEDAEVNPFMIGAYGDALSFKQALFGPKLQGIMTRAFPKKLVYNPKTGKTERRMLGLIPSSVPFLGLKEGFERGAVSPETTRLLASEGGIQKQIFGIGAGRYKNELQKEFSRLRINNPWKLFKRYKNDILDRVAKKYTAPHVEEEVINMIRSSEYQNSSPLMQRELITSRLREIKNALNDRMAVLIGATSDFSPEDEDIQAMLKSEDGERKHRQLISQFYELEFVGMGTRNLRAEVRRLIKEGEISEIVEAGFPKGTVLSAVTAMAKNEDGSPKYTKGQLTLIYRLSMNALKDLQSQYSKTAPIED